MSLCLGGHLEALAQPARQFAWVPTLGVSMLAGPGPGGWGGPGAGPNEEPGREGLPQVAGSCAVPVAP